MPSTYAVILSFGVFVMNVGAIPMLEIMRGIWIPTAGLTLLVFATLAVTRGVGFLLMWGLTLAAWVFMLRVPPISTGFLVWTILAAPLAAIVAAGQPRSTDVSPRATLLRRAITVGWLVLFILAIASEMAVGEYFSLGRLPEWLLQLLRPLWLATPFMIGVHGVLRALTMLRAHKTPTA